SDLDTAYVDLHDYDDIEREPDARAADATPRDDEEPTALVPAQEGHSEQPPRRKAALVTSLVAIAAVAGVLAGYVAVQVAGGWDAIWVTSTDDGPAGPSEPDGDDEPGPAGHAGQNGSISPSASDSASATASASATPSTEP